MFNQPNDSYRAQSSPRPTDVAPFSSQLQSMSTQELQALLEDDAKIDDVVLRSNEVTSTVAMTKSLSLATASACELNLSLQPALKSAQERVLNLRAEVDAELGRFAENKSRLGHIASKNTPDTILALLQSAMMEAEDSAEETAQSLLAGSISCDEFISRFIKERGLAHKRRIKAEKLSELIRSGQVVGPGVHSSFKTSDPHLRTSANSRPTRPSPGYCSPHMR